jgi:hypothetical protein
MIKDKDLQLLKQLETHNSFYLNQDQIKEFTQATRTQQAYNRFVKSTKNKELLFRTRLLLAEHAIDHHLFPKNFAEPSDGEENEVLLVNEQILKQFYSLEYDAELIPNLEVLNMPAEEEDETLSLANLEDTVQEKAEEAELPEEFPTGMKYLFKIIGSNPKITKLIKESKQSKSKWFDDSRIGQEQLYSQLESVLTALKNYTEHSLPFLRPVQKREAPNYHIIIKHPMDLSTVTKKLKSLLYVSKKDFTQDLDLIWSNCLLYNTIPDNPYRNHAIMMRKKATELLEKVPDISIISSSEADLDDDASQYSKQDPVPMTEENSMVVEEQLEIKTDWVDDQGKDSEPQEMAVDQVLENEENGHLELDEDQIQDSTMDMEEKEHRAQLIDPMSDNFPAVRRWKQITTAYRVQRLKFLLAESKLNFGARHIPITLATVGYDDTGEEEEDVNDIKYYNLPELKLPRSTPYCHIPKDEFQVSIMEFIADDSKIPIPPLPSLSEYPEKVAATESRLLVQMENNINKLKEIKQCYHSVTATSIGYEHIPSIVYSPFVPTRTADQLPPFHLDYESSSAIVSRHVATLLIHNGFDCATTKAISTLSSLFTAYMEQLSRTLKTFYEAPGLTANEAVVKSLTTNGVELEDLRTYIDIDVIRYGRKLDTLHGKFQVAHQDYQVS